MQHMNISWATVLGCIMAFIIIFLFNTNFLRNLKKEILWQTIYITGGVIVLFTIFNYLLGLVIDR